jgi:hypothetical protein
LGCEEINLISGRIKFEEKNYILMAKRILEKES